MGRPDSERSCDLTATTLKYERRYAFAGTGYTLTF
jgi:hypothetical protein